MYEYKNLLRKFVQYNMEIWPYISQTGMHLIYVLKIRYCWNQNLQQRRSLLSIKIPGAVKNCVRGSLSFLTGFPRGPLISP